jgi:long-chain acyl-CoA synthetase
MAHQSKQTLPSLIRESISKYSNKTSVVFVGEKNYTYKQMGNDIELLADLLTELGVSKGDKVAILSTNMPNWGVAFFAVAITGAVAVPILPDFHENEIKTIIEHSEAKILFVSENLYKSVSKETTELLHKMILIDTFAIIPFETPAEHLHKLHPSTPVAAKGYLRPNVEEEDLASIIYTSGTTGNSKGVMLTHKNLAWTAQQCATLQEIKPSDRFLSILPLSHTLENTVAFLLPMKYGASVHYLRKPPVPSVLMPAFQTVKPTIMLSVPLIIEKVFKAKILPTFQKSPVMRAIYSLPPFRKLLHKVAASKLHKTFGGKLHFLELAAQNSILQ